MSEDRSHEVFSFLDGLIDDLPAGDRYKQLLGVHLLEGRRQAKELALPSIEIPSLVAECVCVKGEETLPLASACALIYLGADLLDNVADDELSPAWTKEGPAMATLAAATYLGPLITLAVAELSLIGVAPEKVTEVAEILALGLVKMGSGQADDLSGADDSTEEAAVAVAREKTGAQLALFARAGAALGTDDHRAAKKYAEVGSAYGIAIQLATDLQDLWAQPSNDLRNGKRTLPIVHTVDMLEGGDKENFLELLADAQQFAEAHDKVRSVVRETGTMRYVAFVVETYLQRAKRLLRSIGPQDPAGEDLLGLISAASLLPRRND